MESFHYHNDSDSCYMKRPTAYSFYGTAENEAHDKIIGTTRDIWIASYNDYTCVDAQLKLYYMTIGTTLLCCAGLPIVLFLIYIFYEYMKDFGFYLKNNIIL